ncbi:MAG: hypothetical protein AAF512_10850 [Pseudomonadota bacterium]
MTMFRVLLAVLFLAVVGYTIPVLLEHGISPLFPTFFGDIAKMGWPGQFNADFMGFLVLSGIWVAWRNHFSPLGLFLSLFGFFGGIPFLTAYLLYASFETDGDIKAIMLGKTRAQA